MKKKLNFLWILLSSVLFLSSFAACSEDANNDADPQMLIGEWTVIGVYTDNQAVNTLLETILKTEISGLIKVNFDNDNKMILTLPLKNQEPLKIEAAYAFDEKQLAFRFDALPIPFNALDIKSLTEDTGLLLGKKLSKELLQLLVTLVEKEKPEIVQTLVATLGESLKKGLEINIALIKNDSVLSISEI